MMTTTTGVTFVACLIALVTMAVYLRKWWTGGRAAKDIISMAWAFLNGGLTTVCVGGLAGWLAGCTRQAVGGVGGKAFSATTGTDSGTPIATASLGQLTPEGGGVVVFLFVILFFSYKAASKEEKGRLLAFVAAGMVLCVTAGVAGVLDGLPDLINGLGLSGRNALEGMA
ncbi:hypothetical protein OG195_27340 [Streptomyces sp. NBC_01362]|uniref:hypothetical protein n=1 Tax=Streptomyces sp. NBC_01362 TaxID=2903839 RepID=UPI002E308D7F|nr:hypothetical protein [Streptomyces sp. NBC_01362]